MTWWRDRSVLKGTGRAVWQRMHYLTSSTVGCLFPSLYLNASCGSLRVRKKREEVGMVASLPPSLGSSPAGQRGTGPEMSMETRSTLPRWPGSALCGRRCEGSEARRSHWLPVPETAARPCRGRSGSSKAKPHGSTPKIKDKYT